MDFMGEAQDILFAALADPTRRALFERLCRRGEQTVGALTAEAGVSQPAVSKHLGVLKRAGLVRDRHEGRQTHYSARLEALSPLVDRLVALPVLRGFSETTRRGLAVGAIYVVLGGAAIWISSMVLLLAFDQIVQFVETLPQTVDAAQQTGSAWLERYRARVPAEFQSQIEGYVDEVSAAGRSLVQFSLGNIAVGVQVNNQVNLAVLNFGSVVQGGSQTNIINAGNLVTFSVSV